MKSVCQYVKSVNPRLRSWEVRN